MPDDCRELTLLRWYRDRVLATTAEGRAAIEEYERIAPQIVAAVDGETQACAIYRRIALEMIEPAVAAIARGQYEEAFGIYRAGTQRLKARYLGR